MKLSRKLMTLLMLSLVFLGACDKKKSKSSPARAARGAVAQPFQTQPPNNQQQPLYPNQGYNTGSEWVYLQSNDSYGFTEAIRGLVSASMDPQELGYVSSYGDVALIGYIDMNQQGTINQSNSRLRLEIWDDYARSGSASEIALQFDALSTYNYSGNQITLVFQDAFGEVTIYGQFSQSSDFYGTVSFRNKQSYTGNANYASGTIGSFQVPYCGFFRCQ